MNLIKSLNLEVEYHYAPDGDIEVDCTTANGLMVELGDDAHLKLVEAINADDEILAEERFA